MFSILKHISPIKDFEQEREKENKKKKENRRRTCSGVPKMECADTIFPEEEER
jgi:hypothetical protein